MAKQKSAKDIAFDKERQKFNSTIRSLEKQLKDKDEQLEVLQQVINAKDAEIAEKEDWINRLLEYTSLSEEDMRERIKNEKDNLERDKQVGEMLDRFSATQSIFGRLGGGYL